MNSNQSIADSIAILAKAGESHTNDNHHTLVGTVSKILKDTTTGGLYAVVSPIDKNLNDISYVRFSPDDQTVTSVPALGSQVTVNLFDDESGYIAQFGAVSSINLAVSKNGTNYGGLIIISDLVDQLNTLQNCYNDLEQKYTNLITEYNGHTHIASSFGSPTTITSDPDTQSPTSSVTLTTIHDIENPVVVHGNGSPALSTYIQQLSDAKAALNIATVYLNSIISQMGGVVISSSIYNNQYQRALAIYNEKLQTYNNLVTQNPNQQF